MKTKIEEYSKLLHHIVDNISTVIIGKENTVKLVTLSLVSGGHVLI